jgi:glycosyltransferase involved in cell wall biosynthesis
MGAAAVHVVLPGNIDDPAAPSGGNTYDRQLCRRLAAAGRPVREIAVAGAWPWPDPAARVALARALAVIPDGGLVLLDGLVACAAPDVVVPQAVRLRLVVLVHLPLSDETGLDPADAAELDARERRTLRAAAAVIATSVQAGLRLAHRHGLPAGRIQVAEPGVDPAPLAVAAGASASAPEQVIAEATRLLCVAALTPRKGQDLVVEALAEIAELPWRCVFVGATDRDPGYVDAIRRRVRDRRLGDRVALVGPRTGDELAATYASADLLVLASHAETYGMVVTEALARGLPVIATEVGGIPEALGHAADGSLPGILVEPADPAALAAALRRWLTEPDLRYRLRTAARARRAGLPGWEETVRRVATVLDSVLEQTRRAG